MVPNESLEKLLDQKSEQYAAERKAHDVTRYILWDEIRTLRAQFAEAEAREAVLYAAMTKIKNQRRMAEASEDARIALASVSPRAAALLKIVEVVRQQIGAAHTKDCVCPMCIALRNFDNPQEGDGR